MSVLPTPGASDGTYGTELNAFLEVSLDGTTGKVLNEALQVNSTAPVADAALVNKKYVDDNTTMVPAITGAGTGYAGEESITFPNGLILKMGLETGIAASGTSVVNYTDFPNAVISASCAMKRTAGGIDSPGYISAGVTQATLVNDQHVEADMYWQVWGW
jgi:hypothetical protein